MTLCCLEVVLVIYARVTLYLMVTWCLLQIVKAMLVLPWPRYLRNSCRVFALRNWHQSVALQKQNILPYKSAILYLYAVMCSDVLNGSSLIQISDRGITVLCHLCKTDLMSLIICKKDKASCHIWIISFINRRGQQCATEMKCIGKPICLTQPIHKLLFL